MKHNVVKRMAVGALSASLAIGGLPTAAIAEQLSGAAALKVQDVSGSWRQDGGAWSYVKEGGGLATGWRRIGGSWFLFDAGGAMLTGWQLVSGTWYFLSTSTGRMYENRWYWDGASWYWLGADGAMATGWTKVWADWFLMDASGRMLTGWQKVGQDWYYLHENGAMAHSEDVAGYWLREDGVWDDSARPANVEGTRAQLVVEEYVDPEATSALLRIDSDIPFAEQLSTATLHATADWEGVTIESVKRCTPTSVEVLMSRLDQHSDETPYDLGSIMFDAGSFADASATGLASLNALHAEATILDAGYSHSDGSFHLSLNLGSAQLIAANDASAFSLPANPDIRVASASNLPYGHTVSLTLEVPGADAYEQLQTLDDALTQGGVRVERTTIGTIEAYEGLAGRESALDYSDADLTAYIERGAGGKGWQLHEDGSASIELILRVTSTGGGPDLTYASFRFNDEELAPIDVRVQKDSPHQAELTMLTLSAAQLDEIRESLFSGEASDEEILDIITYATAARMAEGLRIANGATNDWGIAIPPDQYMETTEYNLVGLGETGAAKEDAQLDAQDDDSTDKSPDNNFKRAQQAFKVVGTILQAAGNIANAFGNPPKPGSAVVGIGILFNFIGDELGQGISTSWNINDVMNQMFEMDDKIDAITAQLGGVTSQLDKLDASVDYKTQVGRLTDLARQALRYRPWVIRALKLTEDAPDRLTYKLGDDAIKSATGKALQDLYTSTTTEASLTGGGSSTAKVALDLANAITGNAATQQTGAVLSFLNFTANCVNWEPETFYARQTFIAYVGNAFIYAYCAAVNELNHQIYYARDNAQKAVYEQTLLDLMEAAEQVSKLIGAEGSLTHYATDRTNGKVLCTVNGNLYKKSSDGMGAIYGPLRTWNQQETKDTFDEVLTERDEDYVKGYTNQSTMSRGVFETMAKRQAYVRTIPGYEGAKSIRKEMELVGLLPANFSYPGTSEKGAPHDYNDITWNNPTALGNALVGNAALSHKEDAASRYHKRWFTADMYDVDNNCALGRQDAFWVIVDYRSSAARWQVIAAIQPMFEMRT